MANPKATQRVEVTRPFRHNGDVVGSGSVLDLSVNMAIELRTANKVKFVQADTKPKVNHDLKAPADGSLPNQEARVTGTAQTGGDGKPK